MSTVTPAAWPRFWVVDIHSNGSDTTITTGKLLTYRKLEDLKLTYHCMCGALFTRFMGHDNEQCENWVIEHRPHNHKHILNLIPESLRLEVRNLHPEL